MFAYGFLIHALLGALLSSFSLALFSPFVTLRRISYMGEALSHIGFAGIALALLFGWNMLLTTLLFVVAVSLAITWLAKSRKLEEANTITIFLSVSMALGIIFISLKKGYTFDLASYLFGNVLLISTTDLWMLGGLCLLNLLLIGTLFKELFYLSYNADMARFYRMPVTLVNNIFMILLAANIVVNLRAAGIILVSAQLILPAATAFNIVGKLSKAVILSIILAVFAAGGGFALSWWLNLPTGATIVVLEFVLYLLSTLWRSIFKAQA